MSRLRIVLIALLAILPLVAGASSSQADLGNIQSRASAGDRVPFSLSGVQPYWTYQLSVEGDIRASGEITDTTVSDLFVMPNLGTSGRRALVEVNVFSADGQHQATWSQQIDYVVPSPGDPPPSGGGSGGGGGEPQGTGAPAPGETTTGGTNGNRGGSGAGGGSGSGGATPVAPGANTPAPKGTPEPSCWFQGKLAPCDKPPKGAVAPAPKPTCWFEGKQVSCDHPPKSAAAAKGPSKAKDAKVPKKGTKGWITPLDGASRAPQRPVKPKPPVTPVEENTNRALRFAALIGLGTAVVLFIAVGGLLMLWLGGGSRDRPVNYKAEEPFPDEPPEPAVAAVAAEPDAETAVLEPVPAPPPEPERPPRAPVALDGAAPDAPAEEEEVSADDAAPERRELAAADGGEAGSSPIEPAPHEVAAAGATGANGHGNGDSPVVEPEVASELDEIATDAELMVRELCQGTNDPALMSDLAREELKAKLEKVIAEEKARVGV